MRNRIVLIPSIMVSIVMQAQPFEEKTKIVASDRAEEDIFGVSVSISEDYAIIGASRDDEDEAGENTYDLSGSAYIFKRDVDGNWDQLQKIVASDRGTDDNFGHAVSIDADYAIVGAFFDDEDTLGENSIHNAGSAYIFERNENDHWIQVRKLTAPARAVDDWFGATVSICGNYAIVGAELEDEDTLETNYLYASGSAYIFERTENGLWEFIQKITAPVRSENDYFGTAVSINGNYALIGANGEDEDEVEENTLQGAGAAYIFERNIDGYWEQVQKIVPSDREMGDGFGAFRLSINGNFAIIGAMTEDEDTLGANTLEDAGSAYIFERDDDGTWIQVKKITAHDRAAGDQFGSFVSITDYYAVVAARYEDEDADGNNTISNAGSAYIFKRNSSGNWKQIQKITAFQRNADDHFEYVANDANTVMIGAYFEDEDELEENTLSNSGSVYIYELCQKDTALAITACNNYMLNGQLYGESGTYIQLLTSAEGCDSTIILDLVINTVNISVSQEDFTLIADESGAMYQWLDCNNDYAEIPGEIYQSYTPVSSGDYCVEVTKNNCVDTSACLNITWIERIESLYNKKFLAFPNPTSGKLIILLDENYDMFFVEVKDELGQLITKNEFSGTHKAQIEISGTTGVYFVGIYSMDAQIAMLKIVKE